ncbi:hypothetical protein [Olsenella sp. An290]|uniref:cyanophycin synthetase family protein n=1 Tax=Olsenella sp. An290 TaxID=1965625 RepID=UPI000B3A59B1|nr:hypothetical protein [Olsenella sp. An290]OUO32778.1 hypothetical protein B5F84_09140 [Olsenella sp. An290]
MAQLFDIRKVTVGPRTLEAEVALSPSAPVMTSDDPVGTRLVLELMPHLADHLCLGDAASSFGDVIAQTELAHLLEHVTVELLAQTNVAGDISSGQTTQLDEGLYQISLACPDDVLVAGALSSAVWILQWAYSGGGDPQPDVQAIASGLADLVASLAPAEDAPEAPEPDEPAPAPEPKPTPVHPAPAQPEGRFEPAPAAEEPEAPAVEEPAPEDQAPSEDDPWRLDDVPRSHHVR